MISNAESITTFEDVRKVLSSYMPPNRSQRGAYTLERMQRLMEHLGSPQNDYKVIHVAGTSGKTSTSYYIAAMLDQAGAKVGLSVSPHVDEVNERVQINLKPLSEKRYCKEFAIFMNLMHRSDIKPTYFELLSAFAFWEFKRQGCEYAVIEVGLGGLLDATNVISSKHKIAVITDIGFDHEEVLGKTLGLIASQKAGIIKPYNTVVCYEQKEEVMQVIREVASQQQAELHEVWPVRLSELPKSMPLFQRRNWYLGLSVYSVLSSKNSLPDLTAGQLEKSSNVYVPARMEHLRRDNKTVILDGAHNSQKLHAFIASLNKMHPKLKKSFLISFVSSKQAKIKQCLEEILPYCESLIITTFTTENSEKVSVDPLKVVEVCEELQFSDWHIETDPKKAFRKLMRRDEDVLVVTGSFYLLNHIRPLILNKEYTRTSKDT